MTATIDIARLRELREKSTIGPLVQGNVAGKCRIPAHEPASHPGGNACRYEFTIETRTDEERCCISIEPNVTLIGWDDYGTVLRSEHDAALIVAAVNALPALLSELESLRRYICTPACSDGRHASPCAVVIDQALHERDVEIERLTKKLADAEAWINHAASENLAFNIKVSGEINEARRRANNAEADRDAFRGLLERARHHIQPHKRLDHLVAEIEAALTRSDKS